MTQDVDLACTVTRLAEQAADGRRRCRIVGQDQHLLAGREVGAHEFRRPPVQRELDGRAQRPGKAGTGKEKADGAGSTTMASLPKRRASVTPMP